MYLEFSCPLLIVPDSDFSTKHELFMGLCLGQGSEERPASKTEEGVKQNKERVMLVTFPFHWGGMLF